MLHQLIGIVETQQERLLTFVLIRLNLVLLLDELLFDVVVKEFNQVF